MKPAQRVIYLFVFATLFIAKVSFATMIPVNLNDFYAGPNVSVAADGLSAVMAEGTSSNTVFLANNPFFLPTGFAVPTNAISLGFHLSFSEPVANNDTFLATLFNGDTLTFIDDFYLDTTWEGDVSWDLTGLDSGITLLGLEFQLKTQDYFNSDSTASISNLAFQTRETSPAPVPEPGTFLLLGSGLAGLMAFRRKQNQ